MLNINTNDINICKAAILTFGEKVQVDVVKEELAELIASLCRLSRPDKNTENLVFSIAEELADVEIVLEELKLIYPRIALESKKAKAMKLNRLRRTIKCHIDDNTELADADERKRIILELLETRGSTDIDID